jgi:hypothetical protein
MRLILLVALLNFSELRIPAIFMDAIRDCNHAILSWFTFLTSNIFVVREEIV